MRLFLASCSSDADDVAFHETSDVESSVQDEWEPATSVPEPSEQGNDADDELFDIVTCLHDRGWQVSVNYYDDSYGIWLSSIDQQQPYREDEAVCEAEFGSAPEVLSDLTDEDIQAEYDFHVETYHCLVEAGESPAEPTSFQKYLEDRRAQIPTWEPYAERDVSRAEYEELIVECPPVPWWTVFSKFSESN